MDYQEIARIIGKGRCPKHQTKPIVIPNCVSIELKCCCSRYEETVRKKMLLEIEKQKSGNNKDTLKHN
ncbi:MAG: hypothetical protein WCL06_00165 [Bacteroidota bacterium]